MRRIYIIFVVLTLIGTANATDTNGIWHYAKDIRPGVFGSDEYSGTYQFNDKVIILNNLNISTNYGKGLIATSNNDDAIIGTTTAPGKSAIYGRADNSNSYSGFFEGGSFVVNTGNVGIGNINPSAKLDVNGDIKGNDIYSNSNLVATQDWVNSNDDVGWFSGNDGSGSGLDSDLLDGKHWSDIKSYIDGGDAGATSVAWSDITGVPTGLNDGDEYRSLLTKIYKTNQYCSMKGSLTTDSTCESGCMEATSIPVSGCVKYYTCDGSWQYYNPETCSNTYLGYLVGGLTKG